MHTSDFDYKLPEELIAQHPPENRGDSRMMVLNPADGTMCIRPFSAIVEYFNAGDLLTLNNTRVIRARLYARKETGAKLEILLLTPRDGTELWSCLMKNTRRTACGTRLNLLNRDGLDSGRTLELVSKEENGNSVIRFGEPDVENTLSMCGHVPLPPYIRHGEDIPPDAERYQTVYAKTPGAVAAPTAGLHFTRDILDRLKEKGIHETELTLHVGQGTFKPVTVENIAEHPMHSEHFILTPEAAAQLNHTRSNGHRIAAVGTTSLRVLETVISPDGFFRSQENDTSIFIYPPYRIQSADMLLTNFHLPKSTLLMLVSAFAGYEFIMEAYRYAVKERMRFFSYGDCMLILNRI
ncbi:MAG: tRNA preQ1(34) S-adenosylmethionine ribosyltransferase-isomerase QueA [Lentisphaeria bacterium]|nr:tRNA preQ1(34) S-adenosylmethionine ribosyltransferase-isomerase QueA [Lentisphaeria bacterium]